MYQSIIATTFIQLIAILTSSMVIAVPIPVLVGIPAPTAISTQILPQPVMMTYSQALHLLDLSVDTKQMFQTTEIALKNRDVNHSISTIEVITNYCSSFQPFFVGESYCNTLQVNARLSLDLQYLKEVLPVLSNVVQYQEEKPEDDIILSSYLSYCQNKLTLLITSLQTALSPPAGDDGDESSGDSEGAAAGNSDEVIDNNTYQPNSGNNKPSYCFNCTSLADQYYTIKEIHTILKWTTNDVNCVKNQLNNN